VLQDLPEAVNKLAPIEGVKAEAYDFFEKQPNAVMCFNC
jgi:demethylsterigmatocystin 6-O-methyltransferase